MSRLRSAIAILMCLMVAAPGFAQTPEITGVTHRVFPFVV